jgi:hypothetical protein
MKYSSRFLLSALSAFVFSSAALAAGPPSGLDVTVTNTPLPVQGTVNVGNLPTTQAVTVTGTPNVNVVNTPTVQINGTVQTQTGIPATAFSKIVLVNGPVVLSGPNPAGTRYAITSLTVTNDGLTSIPGTGLLQGVYGSTTDCSLFTSAISPSAGPQAVVAPNTTVHLSFPQPFVIIPKAGANSCLVASNIAGGASVIITVVGFTF